MLSSHWLLSRNPKRKVESNYKELTSLKITKQFNMLNHEELTQRLPTSIAASTWLSQNLIIKFQFKVLLNQRLHITKNGNNLDKTVKLTWLKKISLKPRSCMVNSLLSKMRMVSGKLERENHNSSNWIWNQIQSVIHPDATNTSIQTPKRPSMIWTTMSHTSAWTETSKDHSKTSRFPRESLDTTGLVLTEINMQTQPKRLTTTSSQNSMATSLTLNPILLPPRRDLSTPMNSHEEIDRRCPM